MLGCFFFQAEDGIRGLVRSRGLGDVYKRQILEWCRQGLAKFKLPKHVVFTELPKTSTGKIQKFKLREKAKDV